MSHSSGPPPDYLPISYSEYGTSRANRDQDSMLSENPEYEVVDPQADQYREQPITFEELERMSYSQTICELPQEIGQLFHGNGSNWNSQGLTTHSEDSAHSALQTQSVDQGLPSATSRSCASLHDIRTLLAVTAEDNHGSSPSSVENNPFLGGLLKAGAETDPSNPTMKDQTKGATNGFQQQKPKSDGRVLRKARRPGDSNKKGKQEVRIIDHNLYHRMDDEQGWQLAIKHKDIFHELLRDAYSRSYYIFDPDKGHIPGDETAPVPGHEAGRRVLDRGDRWMRHWSDVPVTISTKIEGWRQEALMRRNPALTNNDITARMLQLPKWNTTLGNRMRRFRESTWNLAWRQIGDGSKNYWDFFVQELPEECWARNSTADFHDMSESEKKKLADFLAARKRQKGLKEEERDPHTNDIDDIVSGQSMIPYAGPSISKAPKRRFEGLGENSNEAMLSQTKRLRTGLSFDGAWNGKRSNSYGDDIKPLYNGNKKHNMQLLQQEQDLEAYWAYPGTRWPYEEVDSSRIMGSIPLELRADQWITNNPLISNPERPHHIMEQSNAVELIDRYAVLHLDVSKTFIILCIDDRVAVKGYNASNTGFFWGYLDPEALHHQVKHLIFKQSLEATSEKAKGREARIILDPMEVQVVLTVDKTYTIICMDDMMAHEGLAKQGEETIWREQSLKKTLKDTETFLVPQDDSQQTSGMGNFVKVQATKDLTSRSSYMSSQAATIASAAIDASSRESSITTAQSTEVSYKRPSITPASSIATSNSPAFNGETPEEAPSNFTAFSERFKLPLKDYSTANHTEIETQWDIAANAEALVGCTQACCRSTPLFSSTPDHGQPEFSPLLWEEATKLCYNPAVIPLPCVLEDNSEQNRWI